MFFVGYGTVELQVPSTWLGVEVKVLKQSRQKEKFEQFQHGESFRNDGFLKRKGHHKWIYMIYDPAGSTHSFSIISEVVFAGFV